MLKRIVIFCFLFFLPLSSNAFSVKLENPVELKLFTHEEKAFLDSMDMVSDFSFCWYLGSRYLAVIHYQKNELEIFSFDSNLKSFAVIQRVPFENKRSQGRKIDVLVSSDNRFMAFKQGGDNAGIRIHKIDQKTGRVSNNLYLFIPTDPSVRLLDFSPDGKLLAFTTDDQNICIHLVEENSDPRNKEAASYSNFFIKNKHKLIIRDAAFSPDCQYLILASSTKLETEYNKNSNGCLDVYKLKKVGRRRSATSPQFSTGLNTELFDCRSISFTPDGLNVVISNPTEEELLVLDYDSISGNLGHILPFLKNPYADLRYPHHFSFSQDGQYLAVAKSDTDDSIVIYEVEN